MIFGESLTEGQALTNVRPGHARQVEETAGQMLHFCLFYGYFSITYMKCTINYEIIPSDLYEFMIINTTMHECDQKKRRDSNNQKSD